MDPYAYVSGNPETLTDPTGHCDWWNVVCDAQVAVQAVESFGEEVASDAGSAVSEWGSEWLGPIGIGIAIAIKMSQSTQLGCGCVSPSQAASTTVTGVSSHIARGWGKPRAWKKEEQGDLADALSHDTKEKRDQADSAYRKSVRVGATRYNAKEDPGLANGGMAVLYIAGSDGSQLANSFAFRLGFRGGPHSEAQLVAWAEGQITGLRGKLVGATINLLIYSQGNVCSTDCMPQLQSNAWLTQLYSATGLPPGAASVNMDVWEGMGGTPTPVYTGFTNGDAINSQILRPIP